MNQTQAPVLPPLPRQAASTEITARVSNALTFSFGNGELIVTVQRPRVLQTRPWRKLVATPSEEIVEAVRGAMQQENEDFGQLAELIETMLGKLIAIPDQIADLFFEFAPELKERREAIEAVAYDEEIVEGFVACLKVAFPFSALLSMFKVGEAMNQTSLKSPSRNGASGKKK